EGAPAAPPASRGRPRLTVGRPDTPKPPLTSSPPDELSPHSFPLFHARRMGGSAGQHPDDPRREGRRGDPRHQRRPVDGRGGAHLPAPVEAPQPLRAGQDRKSTRLNSSHVKNSYA